MSGGHFDYQELHLGYIADQLEQDIKFNDIQPNNITSRYVDECFGFQLKPKTIQFLKGIVAQLRQLEIILHKYDYVVSGDASEEDFQKLIDNKG